MQDGARLAQQLHDFSARQNESQQGRARSILGSISRRHRSRTNTVSRTDPHTAGTSPSHLAVPDAEAGRPGSVLSSPSPSSVDASHSAYRNGTAGLQSPVTPNANGTASGGIGAKFLQPQAARILSRLWLTSAATFRRWGKMDECLGAINEAEDVAGDKDPEVWLQVGQTSLWGHCTTG